MIGYLRGRLLRVMAEGILLETGGIGWLVRTPAGQSWPAPGEEVELYTHLVVREDALELYGFTRPEEVRFFTLLLGVAGIGPRGALQIMAAAPPERLARAIVAGDSAYLTTLPGIGAKKAGRLLLELKEAIRKSGLAMAIDHSASPGGGSAAVARDHAGDDALAALLALGYGREEITPVLAQVRAALGPAAGTEAVLQAVLQAIARGGGIA